MVLEPPVRLRLLRYTKDAPRLVAAAARITVSKKPVEKAWEMDEAGVERWIMELIRRGHGSPLEHAVYTFEAECSRVCSHQLVRHRIASYTQQSMRYTEGFLRNMALELCKALGVECAEKPRGRSDYEAYALVLEKAVSVLDTATLASIASKGFVIPPSLTGDNVTLRGAVEAYLLAAAKYYRLLSLGVPREDARFLLPQAVRTRIVFTMNARELLESFLPLRMCSHAQWEIRMLAWRAWKELVRIHPEIFAYAGPRCVYMENRVRDQPCRLVDFLERRCGFAIQRCPEMVPREGIPSCLRHAAKTGGGLEP
ncbi:FAD-dependent thymidylate synthase [Hyperthermus butylicus]|uniref:FAD-dependent thymidylate synthase n=1 Tax=Hyperthermus butylicus TaxID=54248 RepID=UPI001E5D4F51|nr:FAD-dependent thymidylate synthase [Hyperthermus butylicus]